MGVWLKGPKIINDLTVIWVDAPARVVVWILLFDLGEDEKFGP